MKGVFRGITPQNLEIIFFYYNLFSHKINIFLLQIGFNYLCLFPIKSEHKQPKPPLRTTLCLRICQKHFMYFGFTLHLV